MTVWFTADHHFGHANIIRYCRRPFEDACAMDRVMVARWQARVKPGDDVYHLGDFAFASQARIKSLLLELPGTKHLIVGNHDRKRMMRRMGKALWEWVEDYHEVELDGHLVVLNHYPLVEWNGFFGGAFHLHGHCHGTRPGPGLRRLDVGVDCMGFAPVAWQDVKAILEAVPAPPEPKEPYEGVGR